MSVHSGPCRLCGGAVQHRFDGLLLHRHRAHYAECSACGSLQTQPPHWLDEAYAEGNLSRLDTGAAQRNLDNLGAVLVLARVLGLQQVVDHGGGDGLLVRLLRDRLLQARVFDRHAQPRYAAGFAVEGTSLGRGADMGTGTGTGTGQTWPQLVLAFEVLEHFAQPATDLDALFDTQPLALLVSTDAWAGQGPDWWYLAPDTGQHVFFYSRRALAQIAAQRGYRLLRTGGYWLFLRQGSFSRWRAVLARRLLSRSLRRLRNAWAVTRPTPGIWRDHEQLAAERRASAGSPPHPPVS
jgi:hypothetical protein